MKRILSIILSLAMVLSLAACSTSSQASGQVSSSETNTGDDSTSTESAIFNRRSIREYTNQEVSDDLIEKIISAGMTAPSSNNNQPWHFIVIKDRNTLDAITKFHPYSQMLKEVNCAIVVCGDLSLEDSEGFLVQDCSAATENMLLMAVELGLGSVWLGVYPIEDRVNALRELLNIPDNVIPLNILPIGYPAERNEPADRFNPSRIHTNMW